jgi:hypothetical protein
MSFGKPDARRRFEEYKEERREERRDFDGFRGSPLGRPSFRP